jgi:hypothetical protein
MIPLLGIILVYVGCIVLYSIGNYFPSKNVIFSQWFIYLGFSVIMICVGAYIHLTQISLLKLVLLTGIGISLLLFFYHFYYLEDPFKNTVMIFGTILFLSTLCLMFTETVMNKHRPYLSVLLIPLLIVSLFFIYGGKVLTSTLRTFIHVVEVDLQAVEQLVEDVENLFKSSTSTSLVFLIEFTHNEVQQHLMEGLTSISALLTLDGLSKGGLRVDDDDFEIATPIYLIDNKPVSFYKASNSVKRTETLYLLLKPKNSESQFLQSYNFLSILAQNVNKQKTRTRGPKVIHSKIANLYRNIKVSDSEKSIVNLLASIDGHGLVKTRLGAPVPTLKINDKLYQSQKGTGSLDSSGRYRQFGVCVESLDSLVGDPYNDLLNLIYPYLVPVLNQKIPEIMQTLSISFNHQTCTLTPGDEYINCNSNAETTTILDPLILNPPLGLPIGHEGPTSGLSLGLGQIGGLSNLQVDENNTCIVLAFCQDEPGGPYIDLNVALTASEVTISDLGIYIDSTIIEPLVTGEGSISDISGNFHMKVPLIIQNGTTTISLQGTYIDTFNISIGSVDVDIDVTVFPILDVIDAILPLIETSLSNEIATILSPILKNVLNSIIQGLSNIAIPVAIPLINCTTFNAKVPMCSDLLISKSVAYFDNAISDYLCGDLDFTSNNYIRYQDSLPSYQTGSISSYVCPPVTQFGYNPAVPIVSIDSSLDGCYSCPYGTQLTITGGYSQTMINPIDDSIDSVVSNPSIYCLANIVQPLNTLNFSPITSMNQSTNGTTDVWSGSCDNSTGQEYNSLISVVPNIQSSSVSFNSFNVTLPQITSNSQKGKDNYTNLIGSNGSSLLNTFSVTGNELALSGNYTCTPNSFTQLYNNHKSYSIGGTYATAFAPDGQVICQIGDINQSISINEMFCKSSNDLLRTGDYIRFNPSASNAMNTLVNQHIYSDGTTITLTFDLGSPAALSNGIYIILYGTKNGTTSIVGVVGGNIYQKFKTSVTPQIYYINNSQLETQFNTGITVQNFINGGFEYVDYQLVGGGGMGGFGADGDGPTSNYAGGGGGSGEIVGYIGGVNGNFNYNLTTPPSVRSVYLTEDVTVAVEIGSGAIIQNGFVATPTSISINGELEDSTLPGSNGVSANEYGPGSGGDGYNGGGNGSGGSSWGEGGVSTQPEFGGQNGIDSGNANQGGNGGGNGGGAAGAYGSDSGNNSGGGGGAGTGVILIDKWTTGGNGTTSGYYPVSTPYAVGANGMDYTGAGGGGGSYDASNTALPGVGGKGYAIVRLRNNPYVATFTLSEEYDSYEVKAIMV